MSAESGERTEQATEKRMREVRRKGNLARSQDLTAWLGIGVAAALLPSTVGLAATALTDQVLTAGIIVAAPEPARAAQALIDGLGGIGAVLLPLLIAVAIGVGVAAVAQGGVHPRAMTGKYEQFDLVKGVRRVFGTQALWQGAKALMKTALLGGVLLLVVQGLMPALTAAGALPVSALLDAAASGTGALIQAAVIAGLALAAVDMLVIARRNRKHTRMTKREVRDEHKNSEGDPLIRQQRRSRQLSISRNRMIAAVADADVVLVNPTSIAVALRYEPGKSAPRVVAKGAGHVAARIRREAEDRAVPMVRDVPLARALHGACEVGHEIPVELYAAVATVLAFVMALRRRGSAGGMHTVPTAPQTATSTTATSATATSAEAPDHAPTPTGGRR